MWIPLLENICSFIIKLKDNTERTAPWEQVLKRKNIKQLWLKGNQTDKIIGRERSSYLDFLYLIVLNKIKNSSHHLLVLPFWHQRQVRAHQEEIWIFLSMFSVPFIICHHPCVYSILLTITLCRFWKFKELLPPPHASP